jgi:hypothetical protein
MLSGPPVTGDVAAETLLELFLAGSPRQRRSLLSQLERRTAELLPLIPAALERLDPSGDDWAGGTLVQQLQAHGDESIRLDFLRRFPNGWLACPSAAGLEYGSLQRYLMEQEFEQADRLTSQRLRELAGEDAVRRGYVYYSEVPAMASTDLESLDRLWLVYSRGRFGFSVLGRLLAASPPPPPPPEERLAQVPEAGLGSVQAFPAGKCRHARALGRLHHSVDPAAGPFAGAAARTRRRCPAPGGAAAGPAGGACQCGPPWQWL